MWSRSSKEIDAHGEICIKGRDIYIKIGDICVKKGDKSRNHPHHNLAWENTPVTIEMGSLVQQGFPAYSKEMPGKVYVYQREMLESPSFFELSKHKIK